MKPLDEKALEKKPIWEPMFHTQEILMNWYIKILNANLTIEDILALEAAIEQGGGFHRESLYSDKGYTKQEAMIDFIKALCPYISEQVLHRFIKFVLAKEQHPDNTFLRNNELARYLLAYETGIQTRETEIPPVLIDNISPFLDKFSDRNTATIINHSIIGILGKFKEYSGFETLKIPDEISYETIKDWRALPHEMELRLSKKSPKLPYWLHNIYPNKEPSTRPSIFSIFKEINCIEERDEVEEAFSKLGELCNEADSLSENVLGI